MMFEPGFMMDVGHAWDAVSVRELVIGFVFLWVLGLGPYDRERRSRWRCGG